MITIDVAERGLESAGSEYVNTIQHGSRLSLRIAIALLAVQACDRSTAAERALLSADAEVFETMVRAQVSSTPDDSAVTLQVLRVDSRPVTDTTDLSGSSQSARPLDLNAPSDSLSGDALSQITEQRKDILSDLHIAEGGPFNYPDCGGARSRPDPDSTTPRIGAHCPAAWHRYVTVGLPYRGAAEVLKKLRGGELADSTGDAWTVVVTENSIGPSGQTWRKYACLLRRDPETGHLALAERFLMSWAE